MQLWSCVSCFALSVALHKLYSFIKYTKPDDWVKLKGGSERERDELTHVLYPSCEGTDGCSGLGV